jgi:hypothetical protein
MRLVLALFVCSCLFCALFDEKGNTPLPLLALVVTIMTSGMIQVSLAVMTLIVPLLRPATVRSLLLWGVMALVIAVSIRNSCNPAISTDASPDASSSLTLYDGNPSPSTSTAQCIVESSLDIDMQFILDADEFRVASNKKAQQVVEWIMDECTQSVRECLLMWHRRMETLASTLKSGLPASTEFMELWLDVTNYIQALSLDPFEIYQKVWRTVRAFLVLRRDTAMLGLE